MNFPRRVDEPTKAGQTAGAAFPPATATAKGRPRNKFRQVVRGPILKYAATDFVNERHAYH